MFFSIVTTSARSQHYCGLTVNTLILSEEVYYEAALRYTACDVTALTEAACKIRLGKSGEFRGKGGGGDTVKLYDVINQVTVAQFRSLRQFMIDSDWSCRAVSEQEMTMIHREIRYVPLQKSSLHSGKDGRSNLQHISTTQEMTMIHREIRYVPLQKSSLHSGKDGRSNLQHRMSEQEMTMINREIRYVPLQKSSLYSGKDGRSNLQHRSTTVNSRQCLSKR
ncbi:hypothetical protein J6590_033015 [Homalodisca vitripennis]|nr:hypothetical protein J6590_033015 [Homalodisca vitripennis]